MLEIVSVINISGSKYELMLAKLLQFALSPLCSFLAGWRGTGQSNPEELQPE